MTTQTSVVTPCGRWRYELRIEWNPKFPPLLCVMLNPSIATHRVDDPTKKLVWKRADRMGYGACWIVNLGAGRSEKPSVWMKMRDPIGPENDRAVYNILDETKARGGMLFVGWGRHGSFMQRDRWFIAAVRRRRMLMYCLGVNNDGSPKHPLFQLLSNEVEPYQP